MKNAIEKAIKKMAELVAANDGADASMKFAQAALNLAHVLATIDYLKGKQPE